MPASKELSYKPLNGEHYTWTFTGAPIRIHLSLNAAEELAAEVARAFQSTPAVELGGMLLGHSEVDPKGVVNTVITSFWPVPADAHFRPRYVPDLQAIADILKKQPPSSDDGGVVGYYRGHNREGLKLSEDDLRVIESYFKRASDVVLLIKPPEDDFMKAGFFFWDEGAIFPEFSYLEFPFDAAHLGAEPVIEQTDIPGVVDKTGASSAPAMELLPPIVGPAPSPEPKPIPKGANSHGWLMMLVLVAIVALSLAAFLKNRRPETSAERAEMPKAVVQTPQTQVEMRVTAVHAPPHEPETARPEPTRKHPPEPQTRTVARANQPANESPELTPPPAPQPAVTETVVSLTAPDLALPPTTVQPPLQTIALAPPVLPPPAALPRSTERRTGLTSSEQASQVDLIEPKPIRQIRPVIPHTVWEKIPSSGLEFLVRVSVDEHGNVVNARPLYSGRPLEGFLEKPVLDATRQWKFDPARRGGQSVSSDTVLRFKFNRSEAK